MATVIHQKRRDIGGDIGRALGAGFGAGIEEQRTLRESEERSRRLNALMSQVQDAPDKETALKLGASPEFSDLFQSMEEFQTFGQLVEDTFKGENVESIDFTRKDGTRGTAFVPDREKEKISKSGDQDSALSKFLGEEASLGFAEDDKSVVDIFSEAGKTVAQVPESEFDPEKHLSATRFTKQGFDFKLAQDKERRLKGVAGKDKGDKPSSEQLRAIGNLERRGTASPGPTEVAVEMSIIKQADTFTRRLAAVTGMEQKGETFIEQVKGSGAAARFAAATTALPKLMREGLPDAPAFHAARTISNAIPVKVLNVEDVTKGAPKFITEIRAPVQEVDPNTPEGKQLLSSLSPVDSKFGPSDLGKVFKHPDGFFLVYVGNVNGEQAFTPIQADFSALADEEL